MKNNIEQWLDSSWLGGINQSYLEKLYESFLNNPNSIDNTWYNIFKQLNINSTTKAINTDKQNTNILAHLDKSSIIKQLKIFKLINAFRCFGHYYAAIDPLNLSKKRNISELNLDYYNFTAADLQKKCFISSLLMNKDMMKLSDLYILLNKIYCGSIGIEYMHILNVQERNWIQNYVESSEGVIKFSNQEKKKFLQELTAAEVLEKYLGMKFPGAKRFSLEGGDVLIPMLREMISQGIENNIKEIVIGMAHRGRLNVLINVCGKKPQDLFNEFNNQHNHSYGSGDVKYHMGFSSDIKTELGLLHLVLAFNPSHLEIIAPVVMGSTRARIDRSGTPSTNNILPITIHGDAAITGQGVIQETLNMAATKGYQVNGTIRVIINNQIGFTTSNLKYMRSSFYCTDIGKMLQVPIFHVNADDIEAVIFVAQLALKYRNTFKRDVFIDLVCYRRHGHNEADEPSVTQPIMYKKIKNHPSVRIIYAKYLEKNNIVKQDEANNMVDIYRDGLQNNNAIFTKWAIETKNSALWLPYKKNHWTDNYQEKVDLQLLQELAYSISKIPANLKLQERVAKIYQDRQNMAKGTKYFDWGAAENLAYATLLYNGISVRLSGEDSGRGTFFHRHSVVYHQDNGLAYIPLNNINNQKGWFNVWDSVLSEEAVLAFEYGYATTEPRNLIIWEAQFGDFANGAQVVIDQFISSGEQKWGRLCGLVMLLPHGYEGQGPEHSSARLERYLQLCAEQNMQVCIPSTPAQIYHLLRRQILCNIRRPLILITPKSLLRHPLATSNLDDLANGNFNLVIDDNKNNDYSNIKRVIFCSGKLYYDLIEKRTTNQQNNIALIRIEQLYPFPYQTMQEILKKYSYVKDFIWCQEEPLNQGAWYFNQRYLSELIPVNASLQYVGRPSSASPAVGYMHLHLKQQQEIINNALNINLKRINNE